MQGSYFARLSTTTSRSILLQSAEETAGFSSRILINQHSSIFDQPIT
uniref:Uncharacterized protein n=1 Tax=Arundo donax TaxID=35708 RepID=A0A0A9HF07_ARUDO